MKWELDYGWRVEVMDGIEDVIEAILDQMDSTYFDDMLDECFEEANIGYGTYAPSDILKNCDPIAYDCGFENYKDNLRYDIECDLEVMCDGDQIDFYGLDVTCIDEEEEEEED